jgi:flagellar hook-basal body complex protein FliE
MTIDPTFALNSAGSDWQIGGVEATEPAQDSTKGFGSMLSDSIKSLEATQNAAAVASQDLATGKATDPTAVVMTVERAQLAMQLASQIRTKAVEAAQTIFQTQV